MPHVGIAPQNFSTPRLGAALSDGPLDEERLERAHHGPAVLVDHRRLRGDLEAAPDPGLDEAHALAVVRLTAEEQERLAAVVDRGAVRGMQADRLHPQREHRDDDFLDRASRPVADEPDGPAVIGDRLLAVQLPHDVRLRERHLRRDADVGQPVVEEAQVVEHVLAGLAAVNIDPQPRGSGRHLLGELERCVHDVLSACGGQEIRS
jgi:hypothetical protein